MPASALKLGDSNGDWLWHGYFAKHATTLLSSLWKAGKTTLMAHLLRAFEDGGTFCGRTVQPTRVLYVSEEGESVWARRRDALGIKDHVHFQLRPFRMRPKLIDWIGLLQHLRIHVDSGGFGLVFIDPLTTLWPVEKENEAGIVAEALVPLNILTEKAGVVLSHHFRKSGGDEATGSRGSGALPGYVDTIMELRRYSTTDRKDRRRVISGWGRYEETPEELVIELTDSGYVSHGDRGVVKQRELTEVIAAVLPTWPVGWTYEAIKEALDREMDGGPTKSRILEALAAGVSSGLWSRAGEGVRGDPHRYALPASPHTIPFPVSSPYRSGTETESMGHAAGDGE